MKSFKEYLQETELTYESLEVGDYFDIEINPTSLIETTIEEISSGSITISCNESVFELLTSCEWLSESSDDNLVEAEYQGHKVPLGKPMRGDVKKFKVYVKDPKTGNVKKVNFGHGGTSAKRAGQKTMKIKKSNPARRKSFRARHNCANPGPRTKARYWSCRAW